MQMANCKIFKATKNQFCPGLRVLPIWWDQVTAACLSKHVPPLNLSHLQTRNPSEFWVNKSHRHKKDSHSQVCKNSSQHGGVPQLLCPAISILFSLKKVSTLLRVGDGRNFCPCVAPAVGRGQWSYPSWCTGWCTVALDVPSCDAQRHWCVECPLCDAHNWCSAHWVLIPVLIGRHKLI